MGENKKWWVQITVATLLALFGMFKGEILSQAQRWWTALTPGRLVFGGGLLWIYLLLVWRLVLHPIHRQIEAMQKERSTWVLDFNRTTGDVLTALSKTEQSVVALDGRVAKLEKGIKE
jgi:hypothetical protein